MIIKDTFTMCGQIIPHIESVDNKTLRIKIGIHIEIPFLAIPLKLYFMHFLHLQVHHTKYNIYPISGK